MFRQDRTNPSTAVSNWKGRKDSKRGHPSTAVSTWLNGGLFGAAAIEATGGTILDHGGYRHHYFTASGDFVVSANAGGQTVDLILVAGGGGGYTYGAGGGGEALSPTAVACPPATYAIVLGAGGAWNTVGVASTGFGLTADPGGDGSNPGTTGTDNAGACGNGNAGGSKDSGTSSAGGGGGGNTYAGADGVWQAAYLRANGGNGGYGYENTYYQTWPDPDVVGRNSFGGGGGGGAGTWYGGSISFRGNGASGGGYGGQYSGGAWQSPTAGTANSGGGGGGRAASAGLENGLGGSGAFIVRYALDGS